MRSTRNAVLVASALASGSLPGIGTSTALAQGFSGMRGAPAMPGGNPYSINPTNAAINPYAVNQTRPAGLSGANATPRTAPANSTADPTGAGVAPTSPYGDDRTTAPGAVSGGPSPEAIRTSFASPATGAAGSPSPYAPGPVSSNGAAGPPPAPANSNVKPYLASVPSEADAPKPKGLRRIFSFLWHGGSSSEDEKKNTTYDYSTGRTSLPNARPWMTQPSSK